MPAVELFALLIVSLYVAVRVCTEKDGLDLLIRLGCLSVASWLVEESCIRLYGFYSYHPEWNLFLGHVPILIILIWPVIIHSAHDMAHQLMRPKKRIVPLAAAAIVFTDAALVEPVATGASLWYWSVPGLFGVPLIVPFGWATFAGLGVWASEPIRRQGASLASFILSLTLPVVGTHAALLAMWWGCFRWISIVPMDPLYGVMVVWSGSVYLVARICRNNTGKQLGRKSLLLRLPGALFFFTLLVLKGDGFPWLLIYALAFVPPYLVLMSQQYGWSPWNDRA